MTALTQTGNPGPGSRVLCPSLIGRDAELAVLDSRLREAAAGHGRTVLVSGDAGIGKSALLRSFRERARAAGARVLSGECTEIEARRPFAPFTQMLGSAPLHAGGGAQLAPQADDPARHQVHATFAAAIAAAARKAPLVVIVEDLHWADEATLELSHARAARDSVQPRVQPTGWDQPGRGGTRRAENIECELVLSVRSAVLKTAVSFGSGSEPDRLPLLF